MVSEPFFIRESDAPAKREILKAALASFVRDGIAASGIRAIAEAAGYTNPALFKHFTGKEELALCLFERCFERLSRDVERAIVPGEPFASNLERVLAQFAQFLDEDLAAFLYVHEELRRLWPRVSPALRRRSVLAMLRALLEEGRREGAVSREQSVEFQLLALVGVVAQFGRALYFGELSGTAKRAMPALAELISKLLAA